MNEQLNKEQQVQEEQPVQLVQKAFKPGLACGVPALILAILSFSNYISHVAYPTIREMIASYLKNKMSSSGQRVIVDMSVSDQIASFYRIFAIGFGVVALILGLIGLILFFAKRANGRKKSATGLVLSIIGLVFGLIFTIIAIGSTPLQF